MDVELVSRAREAEMMGTTMATDEQKQLFKRRGRDFRKNELHHLRGYGSLARRLAAA